MSSKLVNINSLIHKDLYTISRSLGLFPADLRILLSNGIFKVNNVAKFKNKILQLTTDTIVDTLNISGLVCDGAKQESILLSNIYFHSVAKGSVELFIELLEKRFTLIEEANESLEGAIESVNGDDRIVIEDYTLDLTKRMIEAVNEAKANGAADDAEINEFVKNFLKEIVA